mgnify:CR=1 FL=1
MPLLAERETFIEKSFQELRNRSGNKVDTDKFIAFIYQLCRDYVTLGEIEQAVLDCTGPGSDSFNFTNGYLYEYVKDVVNRLS